MKIFLWIFTGIVLLSGCGINHENPDTKASVQNSKPPKTAPKKPDFVKIIEFFDYGNAESRKAYFVLKRLKEKFGDKIFVEERHFPDSPQTFLVAEATECARNQDKFWPYHRLIFEENFGKNSAESLELLAKRSGMDSEIFRLCMANGIGKSQVQEMVNSGKSLGIETVPFFWVDDRFPLSGNISFESLAGFIQKILAGNAPE